MLGTDLSYMEIVEESCGVQRANQYLSEFQLLLKHPKPHVLCETLALLKLKEILS